MDNESPQPTKNPINPRDLSPQTVGRCVRLLINLTLRVQEELAAQMEIVTEIVSAIPACGLMADQLGAPAGWNAPSITWSKAF